MVINVKDYILAFGAGMLKYHSRGERLSLDLKMRFPLRGLPDGAGITALTIGRALSLSTKWLLNIRVLRLTCIA